MARTYTHGMSFPGATGETDTDELRRLMKRAADLGVSARSMEEALCVKTGFDEAVRSWIQETQIPNGVVRRIILNGAREIVGSTERGEPGSPDRPQGPALPWKGPGLTGDWHGAENGTDDDPKRE